ncbi:hypothetical protein M0G43_07540 [Subsaxibacter sp. CAU 1640]|uniref:CBU_0592 family membrane protein n=1 Tax=Subsaxibacter sp. CAU 1640 TaxID=2933271 RepID=UPI00200474D0|nr:hypothetical protein [Subsaxibacter sp. CAU 1640]MCK7590420.1 hypothetical protein [Subsaxibacter sp. CAU 1640]
MDSISDWVGFIGVSQILLAYFLNVAGKISNNSLSFIFLNVIGAAMACIASIMIIYWPFIILEGIWTLVSLYSLKNYFSK